MQAKYPIILIHGLFSPRLTTLAYSRPLREDGFRVYTLNLPPLNFCSLESSCDIVEKKVNYLIEKKKYQKVDNVGMSLGGVIAYYYVKMYPGAVHVRKMISVGGPINGSKMAGVFSMLPIFRRVPAIKDMNIKGKTMKELRSLPFPENVSGIAIGAPRDPMCPKKAYSANDVKVIDTPYGGFPSSHHMLFLKRENYELLRKQLL